MSSLLGSLACLVLLAGCGHTNEAYVTGNVTLDGEPLRSEPQVRALVVFHPTSGGVVASGNLDENGEYKIVAGSKNTIVPGSYIVTVSAMRKTPAERIGDPPKANRITPAKYARSHNSPFKAEVVAGTNEFDFDLFSQER